MPPVRVPMSWSRWSCARDSRLFCSSSNASLTSCRSLILVTLRWFFHCRRNIIPVNSTRTTATALNMSAIFKKLSRTGW